MLVEIVGDAPNSRQQRFAERDHLIFLPHMAANRQHLFQRAFADQFVILRVFGHHHRHTAPFKIKRDLIHFTVMLQRIRLVVLFRAAQHCYVEQVFQAGLVEAVQPGVIQYAIAGGTEHVGVALQHDFILGQGAGFISAQNVHGAKVLDSIQTFDDPPPTAQTAPLPTSHPWCSR